MYSSTHSFLRFTWAIRHDFASCAFHDIAFNSGSSFATLDASILSHAETWRTRRIPMPHEPHDAAAVTWRIPHAWIPPRNGTGTWSPRWAGTACIKFNQQGGHVMLALVLEWHLLPCLSSLPRIFPSVFVLLASHVFCLLPSVGS